MFESAKLDRRMDKATFKALEPDLRENLLNAQFELIDRKRRSLLVLIHGPDGAGKGAVMNRLYSWLDVRKISTLTYEDGEDRCHLRPRFWKYWRDLPAYGEIGVVLGSWYHEPMRDKALGEIGHARFVAQMEQVRAFETMLDAEGVSLLKLYLYLDPVEARTRLKALLGKAYERPLVREWSAIDTPKEMDRLMAAAEEAARLTSTGIAPWQVVPAADREYGEMTAGHLLLARLKEITAAGARPCAATPPNPVDVPDALPQPSVLSGLDLSQSLDAETYEKELDRAQKRITQLTTAQAFQRRGLVVAFEGSDAAGKSTAIMRLRRALDPRRFRVHPIAAPTDEEKARPYLWRFWRHIPALGRTVIFDRSWYGRVLVERVEGLCAPQDWARAYGEINDFEGELDDAGYVVVKFWLAISQEEQARRFEQREAVPYKRFKLTEEDWRNREKWPLYDAAVTEMVDRTSTRIAPWTLVEAEDKRFARVKVLTTIADRLEAVLRKG